MTRRTPGKTPPNTTSKETRHVNRHQTGYRTPPARTRALSAFSILNGLVLLGVVLQGLWAGGFIGHLDGAFWLQLHMLTAYVVVILALAASPRHRHVVGRAVRAGGHPGRSRARDQPRR